MSRAIQASENSFTARLRPFLMARSARVAPSLSGWGRAPILEGSCKAGLGPMQSHGIWSPLGSVYTGVHTLSGPSA